MAHLSLMQIPKAGQNLPEDDLRRTVIVHLQPRGRRTDLDRVLGHVLNQL